MTRIDLEILADFCALPTDELAARQEHLRATMLPQAARSERTATGHVLEFDESLRPDLEDLIAFERRCCPNLEWRLEEAGDRVRLVIAGF